MKESEFLNQRKQLLAEKEAFEKTINERYSVILKAYTEAYSPVEKFKVYELAKKNKRSKYSRVVIYDLDVMFIEGHPIIRAGGWWLNEESIPAKWDGFTVHNISNPEVFVLSEDQTAYPHPDADK